MKGRSILLTALVSIVQATGSAQTNPRTLHVPGEFPTIQLAVNAASLDTTDTILVEPGVYQEQVDFLGKHVRVVSTAGPEATFITAPNQAAVKFDSGEPNDALLSGFSIANCNVGIEVKDSQPTIVSNVIENCVIGISGENGSPFISSNLIIGCQTDGISFYGTSSPKIIGNTIRTNGAAGIRHWLAWGMPVPSRSIVVENNTIQGNVSSGVILEDCKNADIYQNLIVENGGVGIYFATPYDSRGPRIVNNTICNNTFAGIYTGGANANVLIINNIIMGNPAIQFEFISYRLFFPTFRSNNIFSWTGNIFFSAGIAPDLSGNIFTNPAFACPNQGDYHLLTGSPCLDRGDNRYVTNGLDVDLDGQPRIVGTGTNSPVVDLGAFEADPLIQPSACAYIYCPSNIVVFGGAEPGPVVVEYPLPAAVPGATVLCTPPSGTLFEAGTNVVYCTATLGTNVDTCAFTVTVFQRPPNDEFENARVIRSLPYDDVVDTTAATGGNFDVHCLTYGATVWYKIKSNKNQEIAVSTDGSEYEPSVLVLAQMRKTFEPVACGYHAVRFKAQAGRTYDIMFGANPGDGGRLHVTAGSQPILRAHASIAPTATVTNGQVYYHGTVTTTRPAIIGIVADVYRSSGSRETWVDTIYYIMECNGKLTAWDYDSQPIVPLTGGTVRVSLSWWAEDALYPGERHSENRVLLLPQHPR
jgi:parallel beta-helix repeat protein